MYTKIKWCGGGGGGGVYVCGETIILQRHQSVK